MRGASVRPGRAARAPGRRELRYALATFAENCLTSCVSTATTVPSPIDAALPLTFATALIVPLPPLSEIVTSPEALL